MSSANSLVNKPSLIEWGPLRLLIMDAPKDSNLHLYLKQCKKSNVTSIVRISEPSYSREEVEKSGIALHEMYYPDGHSPPPDVIARWLTVLADTFDNKGPDETPCIAIHCVAGLGRAPVLVAIALIEYGMDAISAVTFIRERRRGAINTVQLNYLESYKPMRKKGDKKCTIM
uniref:protein-tyrosine-phosphatase n=1 Tax=Spumella elongata TaxID=89044 RepID=A0A7S3GSY3_9STRA|mmetsp:Transcript_17927/g.31163  ORF Transcript_17927/g.31163 Transcript_17927/m.31163 type:complete len:172 (+) Transcript_17927:156-671(+)